jgi:hypothetical protein
MSNKQAVEEHIAELNGKLVKTQGAPAEVYSRIVGYYRSVRNRNAGKREEYNQRLPFARPEVSGVTPPEGKAGGSNEQ